MLADTTVDGTFGSDFLKACTLLIDSLKLNNEDCRFSWEGSLGCYRVIAINGICLPPRSEVIIQAKVPGQNALGSASVQYRQSHCSTVQYATFYTGCQKLSCSKLQKQDLLIHVRLVNLVNPLVINANHSSFSVQTTTFQQLSNIRRYFNIRMQGLGTNRVYSFT